MIKLFQKLHLFISFISTRLIKYDFYSFGKKSIIKIPFKINGSRFISIGNDVIIAPGTWIAAKSSSSASKESILVVGDGCTIGHFNHIYALNSVVLEEKVLTADKVYISDNLHEYENINLPILEQPLKKLNPVRIGKGAWIGENVCIIGANVGRNSVIGSNSVVTSDIPDFSIAVGAPARVIKRFDHETNSWVKVV